MKKLLFLFIFLSLISNAMDPAKFSPAQIEAFKRGEQLSEQECAEFIRQNKNEITRALLNLSRTNEELKKQLGEEKYNALVTVWDMETVQELARESLEKQRPFEFNKRVRALITDAGITTYLPNDSITLTGVQWQALCMPDSAIITVAMMPDQAPVSERRSESKNPFARLKKWITRK